MPARRKKTSGKKMTATAAPEGLTAEEGPKEESRPVTQVVEVIEEEIIPLSSQPVEEPPAQEPPKEEEKPAPVDTSLEDMPREQPEEAPTHKSMVEELYHSSEKQPSVMPEISMHKNGSKKPVVVWAIVTIVVALLTGSILFAASHKGGPMASLFVHPTPTPTPAPTATPTPTPATVDKASFTIQVLNGGGTVGAATKMKTFLVGKGYKVSATGNTPDYTYDTTEIHGKSTMTDAVANLKADLKDDYTLGTVATDLDASASADVQVIVGK